MRIGRALRPPLLALAAGTLLVPAGAAIAAAPGRPQVKLVSCIKGLTPASRQATYRAQLVKVAGAKRLGIRFDLGVRRAGQLAFSPVAGEGLGVWNRSAKGVRGYRFVKTVANLEAPAGYRMVVAFRWYRADGSVLREATRKAAICREPDLRPDLVVKAIRATRVSKTKARYVVAVRNRGGSDATGVGVALGIGTRALPQQQLALLARGTTKTVAFTGRACVAGEQLEAIADPDATVFERDEANNRLQIACPL